MRVDWYRVAGLGICLASALLVVMTVHWIVGLVAKAVL